MASESVAASLGPSLLATITADCTLGPDIRFLILHKGRYFSAPYGPELEQSDRALRKHPDARRGFARRAITLLEF